MDLVGQLQPHTPIRFVRTDMNGALAARRKRAETMAAIREALG
jgi:allophanate hydrolase subunit 2